MYQPHKAISVTIFEQFDMAEYRAESQRYSVMPESQPDSAIS